MIFRWLNYAKSFSNVKHLEEIAEEGLELPSVNQVEVGFSAHWRRCGHCTNYPYLKSAPPLLSTKVHR